MKYMKFKNVMIFILSLITVWIVVVFFCYKGYFINIEVGQIQLGDCRDFTTQDSVVFDTGADFSYISSNKIGFPFLSPVLVNDGEGNNKILPMYFTQYFEVNDKVKIKNFRLYRYCPWIAHTNLLAKYHRATVQEERQVTYTPKFGSEAFHL